MFDLMSVGAFILASSEHDANRLALVFAGIACAFAAGITKRQ
jgi:hypothetical protein